MDPITTAILAALAKLSEPVVKDAYEGLKALIVKKFGAKPDLTKAMADAETKPESSGRRETLREEIAAARVPEDAEVVRAAQELLEKVRAQPGGQQIVSQVVSGNHNVFSGTGTVTVYGKS